VDPARVRRHIERLRRNGWTMRQIAEAAGVHPTTVDRIAYGYLKRCSRITARLVLAVDGPPP
jgi:IS30 family transposase